MKIVFIYYIILLISGPNEDNNDTKFLEKFIYILEG